jgi:hypothetical protein
MSSRRAYLTSLVVFVVAAFFTGLVTGVNYGRSSSLPAQTGAAGEDEGNGGTGTTGQKAPQDYPEAPDFELEEPGTGETVELAGFAGSNLVLFISTTT